MENFRKIELMGIVNINGDSFFSGSRCTPGDTDALMKRVSILLDEGADIIDLGACSTRPGAEQVSISEEWRRLSPALEAIKKTFPLARISVDTTSSEIVSRTYDVIGDFIVNDISAGEDDCGMLKTAGSLGLRYVAMHKRGNPRTMQSQTDYPSDPEGRLSPVTFALMEYFREFSERAAQAGITDWILDPGFGFAKSLEQNYQLLEEMDALKAFNRRILVGVSRKSMIYKPLGITPEEACAPTQKVHLKALEKGADILRVHDVAPALETVRNYLSIQESVIL